MSENEAGILRLPPILSPVDLINLIKKEQEVPAVSDIVNVSSITKLNNEKDVKLLVTFVSLYSTLLVKKDMPNWDINEDDAPDFVNRKAKSFVEIIEGAFMSAILHRETYNKDKLEDELTYTELHLEFLKNCSKDFHHRS